MCVCVDAVVARRVPRFGGAMGNELANGNEIWGSIEKLMTAAKTKKNGPQQVCSGTAKQSRKTLLDGLERYVEGYMALFDPIWSVQEVFKHSR